MSYNVTVMPSHGMVIRVNDTAYNITGLYYGTYYIITVYATNSVGDGEPATVIAWTLPGKRYHTWDLRTYFLYLPVANMWPGLEN